MVFPVVTDVVLAPEVNVRTLDAALLLANSVQVDVTELNAFALNEASVPTTSDALYVKVALLQVAPAVKLVVVYVQ